jgi:NDP-sugar pyrophosphorylase family protein
MDIDYPAVLNAFDRSGAQGLMTVLRNGNRWDKSNVVFRDGTLLKYHKRNTTPDMDYIDYGVGILRREVLPEMPDDRPVDLAELYTQMVDELRMVGYEVTNRFYEIGTPPALEEARTYLASRG